MLRYAALLTVCCASPVLAQDTVQDTMPFDACVESQQTTAATAQGSSSVTLDTPDTRTVDVQLPDGAVTITCSRNTGQVTVTHR